MADSSSRAQRGYGNRPWRGCATALACWTVACGLAAAAEAPVFDDVERQPLFAATRRLAEALDGAGAPLPEGARQGIAAARGLADDAAAVRAVQKALDPLCIAVVTINPESRVKVVDGPAAKVLVQQGWRTFLVKVRNDAGITPPLRVDSPNALPMVQQGRYPRQRPRTDEKLVDPEDLPDRFLDLVVPAREPLTPTLTGLAVEYRPVEIFSRDAGMREATLTFDIGAGTQDVGLRSELPVLFRCAPAVRVKLGVKDCDGRPTMAGITIRDGEGRVYPLPSRRLAPDFFFHDQIYRGDGEHVMLPAGDYAFTVSRGPEYRARTHQVTVPEGAEHAVDFTLERWIHAAARGWYSGDHHVHAAGCSHYDSPTEGVGPEAMMRHVRGEDLNVGCVLTWGPCWYTQKRFFDGRVSGLSSRDALLRYDVEVSGFPSSHCGHLCLLRLTEDDYPGTERLEDWPSWTLPVLRWAKEQGAVVGYSHSGLGLAPPDVMPDGSRAFPDGKWGRSTKHDVLSREWAGRAATQLPDDAMPRFDGIGANEYIVAAAHGLCDFISVADTPAAWELTIWYHTLNCGLPTRISGETDFPCIYDERVGLGRVYVGLDPQEDLTYDAWVDGLRDGRSYCGDGRSHLLDFRVDGMAVGSRRADGLTSRLDLAAAGTVTVAFDAAARLEDSPTPETEAIRRSRPDTRPFWDVERCRIGDTRKVPVEIVVNGRVAATRELVADGHVESFNVPVDMKRSGWVAVRILPSCHTNPVFVHVGGRPIRASRGSAAWCQRAVDVCWEAKRKQISAAEQPAARAAYEEAKAVYGRILAECPEKD